MSFSEKLNNICDTTLKALNSVREPFIKVPSALLQMGAINRPGLSETVIVSRIIEKQTKAGAPYGPMTDGSKNISEAMERVRVEEMVKAIKEESVVQIVIPPGGIKVITKGASLAGPVVCEGSNIDYVTGIGIIQ